MQENPLLSKKGFSGRLTRSQQRQAIGKALKGNEGLFEEEPKRTTGRGR